MKVPDLADTVGPVTESNCIGAITPGGEQLEVNHQSVTMSVRRGGPRELDSVGGSGELASARRSPNQRVRSALREWNGSDREPSMVGDRMVGRSGEVNQGTTAGGGNGAGRGQSLRRSAEASNDRGAKGGRNVVLGARRVPSHQGPGSAARLFARMRRNTGPGVGSAPDSGPSRASGRSGAQACAAGRSHPDALISRPGQMHREPRTGKPDAGLTCGAIDREISPEPRRQGACGKRM